jgi:sRNA-binding carbon storage regulator CsrA
MPKEALARYMTNKKSNLILTRKVGDRIVLHTGSGDPLCTITVTNVSHKACKLAFEADFSVRIDREEVYKKKEK